MAEPDPPSKRRILIVEDEMIISMLLEDMLEELGFVAVGPAPRLDEAMAMARTAAIEGALLDMNLEGRTTFDVAEALEARGIPFAFATGYGRGGIPERYRHAPVLPKPFRRDDLARVLMKMAGG